MRCPVCGHPDSQVIDSRAHEGGSSIRRRRRCLNPLCQRRFTTYERLEHVGLAVVKKDGRREDYDRRKLYAGVATACHRRPVPTDAVEMLIDEVEAELFQQGSSEVSTSTVGELVMEKLRDLDEIAYIRFASVYRAFTLGDLQDELAQIGTGKYPRGGEGPHVGEHRESEMASGREHESDGREGA